MAEEILGSDEPATTPLTGEDAPLTAEEKTELTAEAVKEDEATDHSADDKTEDSPADEVKDGAPEEYADFTVPEGVVLDAEALAEATPILKEMGATQEQAQKLIDLQLKNTADVQEAVLQAQSKAWTDTLSEWKDARETDTEYGKGNYDESIALARKGMRAFGEPALFQALEETGMGNHPELIRAFYRVGKAIGEDGINFGTGASEGGKTLADKLFPNQGKAA